MKILVIGQCSLHWGRMEFGNMGNYYIIEPFMRELHKVFPSAQIKTTMQMSQRFCETENITVLPMNLYYDWSGNDLTRALRELEIATVYRENGNLLETTTYIEAVLESNLVIDFSGDIWGDNADFLGTDRFEVGLLKDRVAQFLGKPVVLLAGSPGPFSNEKNLNLAKQVYKDFALVANREPISSRLLRDQGFDVSKTYSLACPAFLFEPALGNEILDLLTRLDLLKSVRSKPIVGFILCGWNFEQGPFDKKERVNDEFTVFAQSIEYLTEKLGVRVCLMSHSNGFEIPPAPFKLKHGRDYYIVKQLEEVLQLRGKSQDFFTINDIFDTWQTKAIIGQFDMLVSGRVHAAVAGLSQCVPTVVIDYGHEPKAHKLIGFAEVADVKEFVADPRSLNDLKEKINLCWESRKQVREKLQARIPQVKRMASKTFDLLREVVLI
ncbi:polysaccharide pyruvyl transferase family protein [Methylotuvimicrobium sp.]|uniref:polysaccharide pyruvyl transferase family protein n=1 Tax=Methylotuvimicrobium sp. TaxID=2822413 RepID=UPI003D650FE4